jgi:hypothetical protein
MKFLAGCGAMNYGEAKRSPRQNPQDGLARHQSTCAAPSAAVHRFPRVFDININSEPNLKAKRGQPNDPQRGSACVTSILKWDRVTFGSAALQPS